MKLNAPPRVRLRFYYGSLEKCFPRENGTRGIEIIAREQGKIVFNRVYGGTRRQDVRSEKVQDRRVNGVIGSLFPMLASLPLSNYKRLFVRVTMNGGTVKSV